jgi:GMP synthase (glutamine-hydrolysing)
VKKLLVFQHIEREHPSNIAEYAKERGIRLDVVELWKPFTMPDVSAYDALVVLGGSMGVYEEFPWKEAEHSAIQGALAKNIPILGVCLGAQLLAYALGARVYKNEIDGKHAKEIGYYDVELTPEGTMSRFFAGFPPSFKVLQWHGDTFDLPEKGELLATSPLCRNQAFSHGSSLGLQFHVEATPEIVADWMREDSVWAHTDIFVNDEQVLTDARALAQTMKEYCYRLMNNFLPT